MKKTNENNHNPPPPKPPRLPNPPLKPALPLNPPRPTLPPKFPPENARITSERAFTEHSRLHFSPFDLILGIFQKNNSKNGKKKTNTIRVNDQVSCSLWAMVISTRRRETRRKTTTYFIFGGYSQSMTTSSIYIICLSA